MHTIAACTSRVGGADVAGCGALKINKLLKTVAIAGIESEVPNKCKSKNKLHPQTKNNQFNSSISTLQLLCAKALIPALPAPDEVDAKYLHGTCEIGGLKMLRF